MRGLGAGRLLVASFRVSEREDSRALTGVRDEGLGDGAGESSPGPPGAMSPAGAVKPSLGAPGLSAPPKVQAGAPARLLLGGITGEPLRRQSSGGQAPAPPPGMRPTAGTACCAPTESSISAIAFECICTPLTIIALSGKKRTPNRGGNVKKARGQPLLDAQ